MLRTVRLSFGSRSAAFITHCWALPPQDAPQDTPQVVRLLRALGDNSLSREALQQALGLSDRKSFRQAYLAPALSAGLVEMTLPDRPNSRQQ